MKRILFVNVLILMVFAGVSFWGGEKEKLETAVAQKRQEEENAETTEPGDTEEKEDVQEEETGKGGEEKKDFIRWVDFGVSKFAMEEAYEYDTATYGSDTHLNWIDLLAYAAAYTGGNFSDDKQVLQYMEKLKEELEAGRSLEKLTEDLEYFPYYQEAYSAVLGGMVGEFETEQTVAEGRKTWVKQYGLKAYHPIAKGFPYNDYDDFGASRSYGYKRDHLGHDMLGQIGTPVIAVESGYIEALGWNQYGGWRIGVRSFDRKRYYYYAHLRQGFPYQPELKEGSVVLAGDVIGYMGHTGYSTAEDTNNIDQTHLHFGMQIIFDESQKDGDNEIWIDCYQIVRFLCRHQSETARDNETKEWRRIYLMKDPDAEKYERTLDFSMYP